MTKAMREAGVCEPVFPEVEEYPAYRVAQPLVAAPPRVKLEEIDLLIRRAARETGTVLV